MARKPHDLEEWLQFLWLSKDPKLAEFAVELQELAGSDCTDEYWELCEELERQTDEKFPQHDPAKALEWIVGELKEHEEAAEARYKARLERAERVVDLLPAPLEYDL